MNGKGFFAAVVRRRRRVLALYAAAAVLCALLSLLVSVNYDINDYLPPDAPSTVAIDVMEEAFGGGIPNVRAMVRDVTVPEALAYKQQIARVEGVTAVTWLDDVADVTVPLEMQDPDTVAAYYKDGAALFTITVSDAQRAEAVAAIDALLGDAGALTGSAVSTAAATNSTVVEVAKIAAIAVLYVVFILALTTASWAEPVLIMVGMGAAILINNGTNLIFGEISFVTSAAGSILQLDLLCHQRRRQHPAAGRLAGLLGLSDPPLCRGAGCPPRRRPRRLHGGGPDQVRLLHPVQRLDHRHRLCDAVPDRA